MTEFNPSDLFKQLSDNNLDPSIFNKIDESPFPKAPNFLEWAVGPQFLNTLILPRQVEIGTKLFNEYCPDCSNPGYIDNLFDQSVGNIRSNVVFLEHGVCPVCQVSRWELYKDKKLILKNELVASAGQRCIPKDSLVFTERGIIPLDDVVEQDVLSHGMAVRKIDSGVLPELRLKTKYNYTLTGSRDSHIIAYLDDIEIKFKHMKDFEVGDFALLCSPKLWPTENYKEDGFEGTVDYAENLSIELEDIVPKCILRSPKEVQETFLNRIPDGYTNKSKRVIKQLRVMFINFGIVTDCIKQSGQYTISRVTCDPLLGFKYFPIEVVGIEEGEPCEMADLQIPDSNCFTADSHLVHNSGKSKLVAMLATYVNHCFLKIPNPLRAYNQTSGEMLMGTFSGLTLDQCLRNLWNPFRAFMDASPWFQNYNRFLREEEKKLGVELIHELQNSITYLHKNIHWYSTGSEARKMRGDTRIFAAIDELGWMVADETKPNLLMMNADAVYTALANSLTTMRTKFKQVFREDNFNIPPIVMANISSPSSAKDKIMRLTKDAKKNDRMLAFNLPTWEMNPDFTYDSLREEFSHMDELTFNRDFGAEPPLAANPFLSEHRMIDKIATEEPFNNIVIETSTKEDTFGDLYKTASFILKKGDKLIPRMLAFDLGFRKNSLSCCMFSLTPEGKPKMDFAIAVMPEPDRKLRVNVVDFFENFTVPLVTNFNIKHAFFDRWQSLDQIERLKIMEVDAKMHSLTYKEMDSVRGSIMSQSVAIPKLEKSMSDYVKEYVDDKPVTDPTAQLGIQLLTVRDMGHKMTKPLLGDDDIFRAFCLGIVNISNPDLKKMYGEAAELNTGHRVAHLGTVRHSSLGGGIGFGTTVEGEGGVVLGSLRGRFKRS